MTFEEFREKLKEFRVAADEEARSLKDSYLALERLYALYRSLDTGERVMADKVFAEWVLSEDENLRFDAIALIHKFDIAADLPALQNLARRLASSKMPSAPFELEKVNRLIDSLTS